MDHDALIAEAMAIVAELKPLIFPKLAGKGAAIQGMVLVDLLAIWLAGQQIEGDHDATRSLRADLLSNVLVHIDQLVALEAAELGTQQ